MKLIGKVNPKIIHSIQLCLIGAFLLSNLSSCKTSSDSFTSRTWHDMNSKYNSVWISREAIKEVERDLFMNRTDNYNRVLDVMVNTDTNKFKAHDELMKKAIKKAANVPNWHDNSGWLDYSYILIGQSRFYLREFEDAINTFKYVNTRGDAKDFRNLALIELMRTYTQLKDYKGARAALNALRKRKLEKEELEEFLLVRGHFFREQDDYIETAKSLGSAVKIMNKGEKKGRLHFILGQIYQKLEREGLSYQNYKRVLKNNPSYELSFYTRLYMAQVSRLNKGSDVKKIERYFKKLLRDEKNLEYQDKIYYEMGLFALRQGNVDEAIQDLNESIVVSTKNPIQKAYSYLKLGEIYYNEREEYETAKVYYDSVLINLPKNVENYKAIEKRQKTLTQFVEQINIYRTQDSLQRLAKIPEPQRGDYITSMLKLEEAKKQKQEDSVTQALNKREKLRKRIQTAPAPVNPGASRWYFDNPEAIRLGLEAFKDRWGNNRPLVDNWRRSTVVKRTIDTVQVTE
ncbi:MAG: tetratricopeptide repeat protein, partial [Bacteroidota bacterium]